MKVPLIGVSSPYTKNLETGDDQVILWADGKKSVEKSPYEPYCYASDIEEGDEYY